MGNSDDIASKYQEITPLGEGAFGKAYKVLNKGDKKFYVNKKIPIIEENPFSESFENEVEILKKFNNEYIVKYYESFTKDNYYNIIIEYCENGDLASFIKKHKTRNNFINEKVIYFIALDICKGIKEIHNMKLIHRDLKPDNLFISKDYKIKIGDFGVSKQLSTKKYAKSQAGTYNYMAPEMINGEVYNRKVDIWSLGCILYELLTLEYCFDEPSIGGLINLIISGNHGKIDTKKYNSKWQNIIDIMLKLDYHDRPEIDEVFQLIYNIGKNNSIYNDKNLNILDEISVNILIKNKFILQSPLKNNQIVDKNKLFENKTIKLEKGKIEFQHDNFDNENYKIFEEAKCIPDIIEYYPVENIGSKINNIIYYEENINSLDLINNASIFEKYINGAFIFCPNLDSFKIINEEVSPVYKKNNKIKFHIIIGGKNFKKVIDFMEENKDSYKFIENKCLYMNESKNYDDFKTILPIYENKNDIINYIIELSTNENKPYPIKRLITYETYLEKYKEIHFKISQFYGDLNLETFKNNISQMKNSKIKEDLEFIYSKKKESIITFDIKKDLELEKLIIKEYTKKTFYGDLNKWLMKTIFSRGGIEYYMARFIYYLNLYAQKNKKFFSENNKELYIGCKRPYSYILQYERAKGKIILITSFKSSSEKKETAFKFAGRDDPSKLYRMKHFFSVIFIIRNIYKSNYIPNGIKVENYSEIVFLPFSFFYINKVQINHNNYTADIYLDTIGKKEILEEQIKKGREIKYNEIENIMEIS